jgi:hypothetical protein
MEAFGFGKSNIYKGKFWLKSTTGHLFEMNDEEDEPNIRNRNNGIKLLTASGNRFEMNDHSISGSCIAGERRGIYLESTSRHTIEMTDVTAETCSPSRMDQGQPNNNAKSNRNFIKLRSGYGLQIEMNDSFTQRDETQQQFIQITAPQKTACTNAHFLRFQELPTGGYVFLRAAGDYIRSTAGTDVNVVGDADGCLGPQNKFSIVTDNYLIDVEHVYFNHADTHLFFAEQYIFLLAGRDCESATGEPTPCIYPVIVARCPEVCPITGFVHWTEKAMSDRVFASATKGPCAPE